MLSFRQYSQLGSNPGGIHTDEQGNQFYVKIPHSPLQAHVEAATADIYNKLGIKTLNPYTVKLPNNKVAVFTKWNPNLKSARSADQIHSLMQNPNNMDDMALLHHAAIVTGNRDSIGLDYSNIMHDATNNSIVSADQGGSMMFRAQGASKPFEADVSDIESFKNPVYSSGEIYGKIPAEKMKLAAHKIKSLTDSDIHSIMAKHNLQQYAPIVKQRRDLLIAHYSV